MEENRNSSFWDLLIWVTVLGAGTFALEGVCIHFIGKGWIRIVFFLVGVFFLVRESIVEKRKPERVAKVGALTLTEAAKILCSYPTVYYTGHCTGVEQYQFMKQLMGDRLRYIAAGSRVEL